MLELGGLNCNLRLKIQDAEEDRVIKVLKELEAECGIDMAHRLLAEKNGAFNKLVICMRQHKNKPSVREECLRCMGTLTKGYPDIVTHEGVQLLCDVLDEVRLALSWVETPALTCRN